MALNAPYVTNAPGGIINQYGIAAGIQALVYLPYDLRGGELLSFYWGDELFPVQRVFFPESFPTYVWVITITAAFPQAEALSNGEYAVYYSIKDSVNDPVNSDILNITVQNSPINNTVYEQPIVPSPINQSLWIAGFNLTIPASAQILAGDTFTVYTRANEVVKEFATGSATAANTAITVPSGTSNPALAGLDGVNTFFYYTVKRGTNEVGTSASRTAYVDVVPPGGL